MAAGLPVICTPSAADRGVIEHGITGFFAYTDEDWYEYLKLLFEDTKLREKIGKAAKEFALCHYNIGEITDQYICFFDDLINKFQQN